MPDSQDVYVYLKHGETDCAYMLKKGTVIVELNEYDSFELTGTNLIFGTPEILLSKSDGFNYFRVFSVKSSPHSEYVRVPASKIEQLISTYNIGFAIARTIAESLVKVNDILTHKNLEVGEKERLSREYCKIYTWATDTLVFHYEKKRFPWLEPLYTEAKSSLTYTKGQAFSSFDKKSKFDLSGKQVDEFSKQFPSGSNVCEQGDPGDELFILRSGKLKVFINDNPIAVIEDSGSVIGEMALLLGEVRTATLQSIDDNTILTVVNKKNLKEFAESQPAFLMNISIDLSRRLISNCTIVNDLTEIIEQNKKTDTNLPQVLREDKYKAELKTLKQSIKELYEKYDMEWLYDLSSEVTEKMLNAREK